MSTQSDAAKIAVAFWRIYDAALVINEVLRENDDLNETVPSNWPLNLSADEFAAECLSMVEHYSQIGDKHDNAA
jgi:hypothetical protein